jgi:ligand-binding SRPBCC domain-containing protein
MKLFRIERRQRLAADLPQAWRFFADPANLRTITPPWLDFTLTCEVPADIYAGLIITYRIRPLAGMRCTWVSEITQVRAPHYFVDEQRSGPYRFWHHQHHLQALDNGCAVEDIVHYGLPLGVIGEAVHALWVRRKLDEIFRFRYHALSQILNSTPSDHPTHRRTP